MHFNKSKFRLIRYCTEQSGNRFIHRNRVFRYIKSSVGEKFHNSFLGMKLLESALAKVEWDSEISGNGGKSAERSTRGTAILLWFSELIMDDISSTIEFFNAFEYRFWTPFSTRWTSLSKKLWIKGSICWCPSSTLSFIF